ncbi:MAG: head-tail connector protein [Methylobacter sp.]
MNHLIKTPPATEPITLAEMRSHLGITQAADTSRDTIITGRIISARQWAEHYTRTAYITQTWTGYAVYFPYNLATIHRINLKAPLLSVTSVKYLDETGVQQTLAPSLYLVDLVTACIVPAYNQSWPTVSEQLNSVQVEYVSGYGAASAVPESIKDAVRFIVGQWEVFQSSIEGVMRPFTIPNAAKQLLDDYVDMREYF